MSGKRKLYTTGEIADRLGVSRQRALQITNDRREDFPQPFDILPGAVQVWLRADVEQWIGEKRPQLDAPDDED